MTLVEYAVDRLIPEFANDVTVLPRGERATSEALLNAARRIGELGMDYHAFYHQVSIPVVVVVGGGCGVVVFDFGVDFDFDLLWPWLWLVVLFLLFSELWLVAWFSFMFEHSFDRPLTNAHACSPSSTDQGLCAHWEPNVSERIGTGLERVAARSEQRRGRLQVARSALPTQRKRQRWLGRNEVSSVCRRPAAGTSAGNVLRRRVLLRSEPEPRNRNVHGCGGDVFS